VLLLIDDLFSLNCIVSPIKAYTDNPLKHEGRIDCEDSLHNIRALVNKYVVKKVVLETSLLAKSKLFILCS